MQLTIQDKNMKKICLVIVLAIWAISVFSKPTELKGDSVGVKMIDGSAFIIYKVSGGETIYSVSRKYLVPMSALVSANPGVNMDQVQAGQKILIPSKQATSTASTNAITDSNHSSTVQTQSGYHTVAAGETLYAIARKYQITFAELKSANPELNSDAIVVGQKVKIPGNKSEIILETTSAINNGKTETANQEQAIIEIPEKEKKIEITKSETDVSNIETSEVETPIQDVEKTLPESDITSSTLPVTDKNKPFSQTFTEYSYTKGLIAESAKGVATWIEGSNDMSTANDRYYALHNEAPIGSVIKIRNLMNNRVIYAKVIGTLSESEVNEKVMVKLSAGAAQKLNVLDSRFVVEATFFDADTNTSQK